jgi:uncharacterized protein
MRQWLGVLLALAAGILPLGRLGARAFPALGPRFGAEAAFWIATAALLLYVLVIERRPLASIGLRRPGTLDVILGCLTGVVLVAGIMLIYARVFPLLHLQPNAAARNDILRAGFLFRCLLVTRAAVYEELVFRAYPLERLRELTGGFALPVLVSAAAFTYAHLPRWGAAQLIVAAFGGLVLAGLYVWRRNAWANMLAHWIADGAGFLLPH